jgi:putative flavoprotein involved in K+ transport
MTSLPKHSDTVIVGAGQAGLTMSWHLQRGGRDHVLLERRSTLGGGWQDRWDEFRLVGPNWTASFPDAPYDGPEPDAFMPRDEIAGRVAAYAGRITAPVLLEAAVSRLRGASRWTRRRASFMRERSSSPRAASTGRTSRALRSRCPPGC